MVTFLGTLFIVICLLLIVVVLLQKGRGGGLGAAFGGTSSSSAFGTRTGDVFTWVTIVLTGLFVLVAVVATLILRPAPMTVATVQFTPAEAAIAGPVGITMYCETPQADIRYTTDDMPVTAQSPLYQKTPVTVSPGATLRAKAFRRGYKDSPEVRVEYTSLSATRPAAGETGIKMPTTAPAPKPVPAPKAAPAKKSP
ncbi:MAG: preprotein translocase subunit SecG [Phycisphaerae bacterium]|jgi:preprotein translocase subunit SecG